MSARRTALIVGGSLGGLFTANLLLRGAGTWTCSSARAMRLPDAAPESSRMTSFLMRSGEPESSSMRRSDAKRVHASRLTARAESSPSFRCGRY